MARRATRRSARAEWQDTFTRLWSATRGALRVFGSGARGVYAPQEASRIVLGVALSPDTDLDWLGRQLWWRGLGLVQRGGEIVAGADVTAAIEMRRAKQARAFVTRQLRDAGVRGPIRRWELGGETRSRRR